MPNPKGRRVPPPRLVVMPEPNTATHRAVRDDDEQWFLDHPKETYRRRPYVPGETPQPMPPGTVVHVYREGFYRIRSFEPGPVEEN